VGGRGCCAKTDCDRLVVVKTAVVTSVVAIVRAKTTFRILLEDDIIIGTSYIIIFKKLMKIVMVNISISG
jgi:hypothetical protein